MTRHPTLLAGSLLALFTLPALAGRPLSSDDASTADAGTCQVEAWAEKAGSDRATVLAPACGLLPGLEVGADVAVPRPRNGVRAEAGLAVKLAPEGWKLAPAGRELRFGLKVGAGWLRPESAGWQATGSSLLGLASLEASETVSLHLNLGVARDRASRTTASVGSLALVWKPLDPLLLFAETQVNNRRDTFGATVNSAGVRWWLLQDRLGLDLSAGREAVSGATTTWTLGLGWYAIGF